jgi:hypothetical protein
VTGVVVGVVVVGEPMNNPQVILFSGTSHDIYWYNRTCGPYKLATYLRQHGFTVQVIPNCTALTRSGYQQVFRKYASPNLLWIGFTTNWLSGRRDDNYYEAWWNSNQLLIDAPLSGWYFTDHDDRDTVYKCIYDEKMFDDIWQTARSYSPTCQLLFGGSQLNRNEYFVPKHLHPRAAYIKNNAESAVLEITRRLKNYNEDKQSDKSGQRIRLQPSEQAQAKIMRKYRKLNSPVAEELPVNIVINNAPAGLEEVNLQYLFNNLPSNDYYDYNNFKKSFIEYQDTDYVNTNEWLPIEIARGCAFKCKFCNYDMKGVTNNYVDANYLREKIIELYETYGTTKFVIMDDLYNDNYDKVRDLHENCWSKLPFKPELAGYLRLDLLWHHPEQAEMLRADGWRACSVGIETLHDQAGKRVGKGLGKKRIFETLEMLKEIWQDEVLIHAFFIAGLPNEPLSSLEETFEWTKSTDLIHAVIWHWLELENIDIMPTTVDKISIIGKDHKKYGYTFVNNTSWVNNTGISLEQAKEFNQRANTAKMNTYFTLYADMRALGMSHEEIMTANKNVDYKKYLYWENNSKQPASKDRLLKIISNV